MAFKAVWRFGSQVWFMSIFGISEQTDLGGFCTRFWHKPLKPTVQKAKSRKFPRPPRKVPRNLPEVHPGTLRVASLVIRVSIEVKYLQYRLKPHNSSHFELKESNCANIAQLTCLTWSQIKPLKPEGQQDLHAIHKRKQQFFPAATLGDKKL